MEDEDKTFNRLKQIPFEEMTRIAFLNRKNPFSPEWKDETEDILLANGWTSKEFAIRFLNELNNYNGRTTNFR